MYGSIWKLTEPTPKPIRKCNKRGNIAMILPLVYAGTSKLVELNAQVVVSNL